MAKSRSSNGKKKNISGMINLKIVVERLQKSLLSGKNKKSSNNANDEILESNSVPKDVKEGHFAVIAVDGEGFKRFIVPLSYLTNPSFLRLLEQAEEEYGFNHDGALMVPCRPSEMEWMLAEERDGGGGGGEYKWSSCHERTIVISLCATVVILSRTYCVQESYREMRRK